MKVKNLNRLEEDYRYCEDIIKRHSKSFYYAFKRLPEHKARAVFAIYAFCRLADDSVDNSSTKEEQELALNGLRQDLYLFEQQEEKDHPLWRALRDVFNRYDMSLQPFYDQLFGQRMDIYFRSPETMEEVEEYSYYVAGSVGLMLLPIIASEAAVDLREHAVNLGIAMQLTNMLRDVGEDYFHNGRIYLPMLELEKEGYTTKELDRQQINPGFIKVWEKMAVRAEALYDTFSEEIHYYDEDSQFPVLLSAQIYRGIIQAVRDHNYDCLKRRNYVSPIVMKRIYQETKGKVG
ncbi:Dehydrosqualene synthase [Oceanobacillus picturae]|uniref:Dehydrosqualene synthase n=1 Tax=Oceanobacillus picturae TaxID=171693 RepID=W9AAT6_9BACI|nr:phytoene/squalene synthase family protein [Oceanobacillus picturae]CDO02568.1 Dehydrosqualene synthase [Oceanobacillus picturae]